MKVAGETFFKKKSRRGKLQSALKFSGQGTITRQNYGEFYKKYRQGNS